VETIHTLPITPPKGGGEAAIRILSDRKGFLAVPQSVRGVLLDYNVTDKHDKKAFMGGGTRAIDVMTGKEELTVELTFPTTFGEMLNGILYGEEIKDRARVMLKDTIGYVVPDSVATLHKIRNTISIHFGRWDSSTSVKINNVVATSGSAVGQFTVSNGVYRFNAADKNKAFSIVYVSDGTTITATGKIPSKLTFDIKQFSDTSWTSYAGTTKLTQDVWNPASAAPAAGHFQGSANGVGVFNSGLTLAVGKVLKVTATIDGQLATLSVDTLPAADYVCYVDPPSAAAYVSHVGVELYANTGTAMTGVNVGDELTVGAGAPSGSGHYQQDDKGKYVFHSTDAGDTVSIKYVMDYYSVTPVLRDARGNQRDGTFIKDWGVYTQEGKPLKRVALTSPLSLADNQYVVIEKTGQYIFNDTNAGDRLFFSAEFEVDEGTRIEVMQQPIGSKPIVEIAIDSSDPGQSLFLTIERAVCEGMGIKTKTDDYGDGFKFTFACAVDRMTGLSHTISTSS
jgi:hypothetical protein